MSVDFFFHDQQFSAAAHDLPFFEAQSVCLSPSQGLPGPPGEKGENGDVGAMVRFKLLWIFLFAGDFNIFPTYQRTWREIVLFILKISSVSLEFGKELGNKRIQRKGRRHSQWRTSQHFVFTVLYFCLLLTCSVDDTGCCCDICRWNHYHSYIIASTCN